MRSEEEWSAATGDMGTWTGATTMEGWLTGVVAPAGSLPTS